MRNTVVGAGFRRIVVPVPPNGRKDRDEDLLLFQELHKRERERMASLLLPVSDEFEPNGGYQHARNYSLYRFPSTKRGSGYEFLGDNEKSDYDWLKTPPATPLFPSLEMESNAPELAVQRDLPIIQPPSRFSGNSEESKASNGRQITPNSTFAIVSPKQPTPVSSNDRPKTPNPTLPNVTPKESNPVPTRYSQKPKAPQRSVTPGQKRPSISSNTKLAPTLNQRTTPPIIADLTKRINIITTTAKSNTIQGDSHMDLVNSNISKDIATTDPKTKPRSRGVSPIVRSTLLAQFEGFSDETPPNLRTDRSTSASRDRLDNPTIANQQKPAPSFSNPTVNIRTDRSTSALKTDRSNSASRDRAGNPTISNQQKPAPAFSNPTVNLQTDRSASASRNRPVIKPTDRSISSSRNRPGNSSTHQTPVIDPRRQSWSPSEFRGRKLDNKEANSTTQKGSGTQVFGSKMVDKLMNARKYGGEDRETRQKSRGSNNEATGFGRMISKSSLETAIKHMETKQDRTGLRQAGQKLLSPGVER